MSQIDIHAIVSELNARSQGHPIGKLQETRKALKGLDRLPGQEIFRPDSKATNEDWAFHYGGRSELQFNVGKDGSGGSMLRHGVAFSFETSRTLPSIDVLKPKVRLFGEFLELYPNLYADMRMWHWQKGVRSSDAMPGPIPPERVTNGVFVFLGKLLRADELDYDLILSDFDRLLPLYLYVEGNDGADPVTVSPAVSFAFSPGCSKKAQSATALPAQNELDVVLRHNLLQERLYDLLVAEFGSENVGTELASGVGTRVDVVVRRSDGYWFYEIKTARSPRACIREALGQLLEYAFWPGAQQANRLVVVGESAVDDDGQAYLSRLKEEFSLPVEYRQITI